MTGEEVVDESAARLRTLADLALRARTAPDREAPPLLETGAGPLETFTMVLDALAADLDLPRAEVVGRMVTDLRRRIDLDRATLALLLLLQEANPSVGTKR